jgi:hypothetical protein
MTDDKIARRELLEKGSDTSLLRDMIGFAGAAPDGTGDRHSAVCAALAKLSYIHEFLTGASRDTSASCRTCWPTGFNSETRRQANGGDSERRGRAAWHRPAGGNGGTVPRQTSLCHLSAPSGGRVVSGSMALLK